jgi:hypothetical protein
MMALGASAQTMPADQGAAGAGGVMRTWTTTEGKTFEAALVRVEGATVFLKLTTGQIATIPSARLSANDQALLKPAGPMPQPAAGAVAATPAPAAVKRTWPAKVEVDNRAIEVKAVQEDSAEKKYVYRSQAFEFTSGDKLAGSVMKEIARTFEATRTLMEALPWGINPRPPVETNYYQAQFYVTREDYIAAGGPPNSGGVYFSGDRIFRVPFPSLGLEMRGKTWFKDQGFRNDTVIHEITHQMMHDYLPFLPTWVIEGTAEYAEMLPYNAGRFLTGSHERGMKEYLKEREKHGLNPGMAGSFLHHANMDGATWKERAMGDAQARLYMTSCLLVYYFCHLEGDGTGARFFQYLDKMKEAREAWQTFFKDPRVKLLGNGRFQYRNDIALPAQKRDESYGREHLSILLNGRTDEQFQQDVVNAYKKIGVRW